MAVVRCASHYSPSTALLFVFGLVILVIASTTAAPCSLGCSSAVLQLCEAATSNTSASRGHGSLKAVKQRPEDVDNYPSQKVYALQSRRLRSANHGTSFQSTRPVWPNTSAAYLVALPDSKKPLHLLQHTQQSSNTFTKDWDAVRTAAPTAARTAATLPMVRLGCTGRPPFRIYIPTSVQTTQSQIWMVLQFVQPNVAASLVPEQLGNAANYGPAYSCWFTVPAPAAVVAGSFEFSAAEGVARIKVRLPIVDTVLVFPTLNVTVQADPCSFMPQTQTYAMDIKSTRPKALLQVITRPTLTNSTFTVQADFSRQVAAFNLSHILQGNISSISSIVRVDHTQFEFTVIGLPGSVGKLQLQNGSYLSSTYVTGSRSNLVEVPVPSLQDVLPLYTTAAQNVLPVVLVIAAAACLVAIVVAPGTPLPMCAPALIRTLSQMQTLAASASIAHVAGGRGFSDSYATAAGQLRWSLLGWVPIQAVQAINEFWVGQLATYTAAAVSNSTTWTPAAADNTMLDSWLAELQNSSALFSTLDIASTTIQQRQLQAMPLAARAAASDLPTVIRFSPSLQGLATSAWSGFISCTEVTVVLLLAAVAVHILLSILWDGPERSNRIVRVAPMSIRFPLLLLAALLMTLPGLLYWVGCLYAAQQRFWMVFAAVLAVGVLAFVSYVWMLYELLTTAQVLANVPSRASRVTTVAAPALRPPAIEAGFLQLEGVPQSASFMKVSCAGATGNAEQQQQQQWQQQRRSRGISLEGQMQRGPSLSAAGANRSRVSDAMAAGRRVSVQQQQVELAVPLSAAADGIGSASGQPFAPVQMMSVSGQQQQQQQAMQPGALLSAAGGRVLSDSGQLVPSSGQMMLMSGQQWQQQRSQAGVPVAEAAYTEATSGAAAGAAVGNTNSPVVAGASTHDLGESSSTGAMSQQVQQAVAATLQAHELRLQQQHRRNHEAAYTPDALGICACSRLQHEGALQQQQQQQQHAMQQHPQVPYQPTAEHHLPMASLYCTKEQQYSQQCEATHIQQRQVSRTSSKEPCVANCTVCDRCKQYSSRAVAQAHGAALHLQFSSLHECSSRAIAEAHEYTKSSVDHEVERLQQQAVLQEQQEARRRAKVRKQLRQQRVRADAVIERRPLPADPACLIVDQFLGSYNPDAAADDDSGGLSRLSNAAGLLQQQVARLSSNPGGAAASRAFIGNMDAQAAAAAAANPEGFDCFTRALVFVGLLQGAGSYVQLGNAVVEKRLSYMARHGILLWDVVGPVGMLTPEVDAAVATAASKDMVLVANVLFAALTGIYCALLGSIGPLGPFEPQIWIITLLQMLWLIYLVGYSPYVQVSTVTIETLIAAGHFLIMLCAMIGLLQGESVLITTRLVALCCLAGLVFLMCVVESIRACGLLLSTVYAVRRGVRRRRRVVPVSL